MVWVLIVVAYAFTPVMPQDFNSSNIEPLSINQLGEYEREFIFDVQNIDVYKKDIAFFTKHQYIEVYCDNELIYEYTTNGSIWGHTNGAFGRL